MSTREDFEAWAISVQLSTTRCEGLGGYAFYETRKALESWQAATSRQEAKIKALVDALEEATPSMPREDAMCHYGLVKQADCDNCQRIARSIKALAATKETP
jgi:hypothetical protein